MALADIRRFPRWSFTVSSRAEVEREQDSHTAWNNRLESLGLGERTSGDLPGFHFIREAHVIVEEGARIQAYWASGGSGIQAIVRNWQPRQNGFEFDIVEDSDGLTWRTYEWRVEPISSGRSLERLRIKVHVPIGPFAILKFLLMWPFLGKLAKDAIHGRC